MSATTSQTACQAACGAAERAVRDLIQLTRPAVGGLTGPVEAGEVIAALAAVTGMLPQLLDQLSRWLLTVHDTGRLGVDADATHPDARHAVHAAAAALEQAGHCLHRTAHALDDAHQHTTHLVHDHRDEHRDGDDQGGDGERGWTW